MLQDRIKEIQQAPNVEGLRDNTSSKTLYDAYAKDAIAKTGGEWKKGITDREIAVEMMKDDRPLQRIQDAMRHSPSMEGLSGPEKTVKSREIVQDASKSQEVTNQLHREDHNLLQR